MSRASLVWHWLWLGGAIGLLSGAASALFLWSLDWVTTTRLAHEGVVFALPLAGVALGVVYERFGSVIKRGNNLVIDRVVDGGAEIPVRMAPMVLLGTLVTHLFGGSAGREGTAVQMSASLADWVSHRTHVSSALRAHALCAGIAGGFGAVFGTPLAGVLFGLEVAVVGKLQWKATVPAFIAAFVGDATTRRLGITHTFYPHVQELDLTPLVVLKWCVFGVAIAIAAAVFIELTHWLKTRSEQVLPSSALRMAVGGVLVVVAWKVVGSSDFLGLGVPTLVRAFVDPTLPPYAFALKLGFTALTIGFGFIGGEVTPLFFVGAALGNALAQRLGLPLELGAGVGMAAMFGAASNTPLALTVMAVELLGLNVFPHAAIACVVAYLLIGRRSIYSAQRQ